jgi:recombination protein RecT
MSEQVKEKKLPLVIDAVQKRMPSIAENLPASVPSGRFLQIFKQAVMKDRDLENCNPLSVVMAVSKCAADGLVLDGREAALVRYKGEAQYVPMVAGLLKRAYSSGYIAGIDCAIVYQEEVETGRFKYLAGTEGSIYHEPIIDHDPGERAGVYAIFKLKTGGQTVVFMRADQVNRIRSKAKTDRIWASDTDEMWKKTVLRRGVKLLPFDSDLSRVFSRVDDLYDIDEAKDRGGAAAVLAEDGEIEDAEYDVV